MNLIIVVGDILQIKYSHNDYQKEQPLFGALRQEIFAVEVDIVIKLWKYIKIGHEPYWPWFFYRYELEENYLKNIDLIFKHNLQILPDKFYLILDFKSASRHLHKKLYDLLKKYANKNIVFCLTAGDNWFTERFASRKKSMIDFYEKYKNNSDGIQIKLKSDYEFIEG